MTKIILVLMAATFLTSSTLKKNMNGFDQSSQVKLEVRGLLLRDGRTDYIQTNDAIFPNVKLRVILERSEDKNRLLDRYLDHLQGKHVVVTGSLDCRRIGKESGIIYLYFSNESQMTVAEGK